MRFIDFDKKVLEKSCHSVPHKNCQAELEEFMKMKVECVKVVFGESEYVCAHSARSSFAKAIKIGGFPVKVILRKDVVYLIRTDI